MTSWLDRDGVRICYDVIGDADDAVPLLLTHGYGATRGMWSPNVEALAAHRRVITWDLRGHGDSDSPEDQALYTHQLCVEDMRALLDACEAPVAAVGGLSLGGFLSLDFYRTYPDRVSCLLLFDTGPGYKNDEARGRWNDDAARTAGRHEERGALGLARAARGMLAQQDAGVIRSLPNVSVPTMVLVGADDKPFLAAADYMAATIPDATKVVLPDAGHSANIDQPGPFNEAVGAFLARCQPEIS